MLYIRCAFCHERVFRPLYARHRAKHTKLRPDGQMTDHITVRPQERYQGSLEKIPKHYRHPRCNGATTMPEDIIRSYLVNPFLYCAGRSFCTGCGQYPLFEELFWSETGQCLADYFRELQQEYLRVHGKPPPHPTV